jgi:5-methylcytosine-specific restriction enzyme subunit McrC
MILLFEYGEWVGIKNKIALKQLLKDIWQKELFVNMAVELTEEKHDFRYQPFLTFDDDKIRAKNFVGFIQTDENLIEIYPKVFRNAVNAKDNKGLMLQHIFYWLNYCRKWRFPFNQSSLDIRDIKEFPELIINLIANQFLETISKQLIILYQEVDEALQTPRGTINFKRYINNGLSHGIYHSVDCDYEPFSFDNKINRIIKYCSRLLISQTKFSENQRILQEVIFVLDEVDDVPCNIHDVERSIINPYFEDYSLLLDSCKLVLSQQLYSNQTYDLTQWCLLLPMEYIFEDFLAGFLESYFRKDWKVEYQNQKNI